MEKLNNFDMLMGWMKSFKINKFEKNDCPYTLFLRANGFKDAFVRADATYIKGKTDRVRNDKWLMYFIQSSDLALAGGPVLKSKMIELLDASRSL